MNCPICSSSMSESVEALFALPSVASDCRPWSKGCSVKICSGCGVMKRVTNADFDHEVYKNYTSYPEPTGRTKKILEFVADKMPQPKSILDIGCGQGHGVKVMEAFYPNAKVDGYEPTVQWHRPVGKYDLITLFHVFEHVSDLHEMLAYIKSSLTENGHVLIQVPYAAMWPFDLIIADHEWHFNIPSLISLLFSKNFQIRFISNDLFKKEITIIAFPAQDLSMLNSGKIPHLTGIIEFYPIDWLINFKKKLDTITVPVAIYGTSVSAMWASGILGDKVICYIDDDVERLKEFNGKPVAPAFNCKKLPIVAPFPDWQLEQIRQKHPELRIL